MKVYSIIGAIWRDFYVRYYQKHSFLQENSQRNLSYFLDAWRVPSGFNIDYDWSVSILK